MVFGWVICLREGHAFMPVLSCSKHSGERHLCCRRCTARVEWTDNPRRLRLQDKQVWMNTLEAAYGIEP